MRSPGVWLLVMLFGCSGGEADAPSGGASDGASGRADVTAVSVSGGAGSYTFAVTITSPDTGCGAYADWWEVVGRDGTLKYRRILAHSHVDEQPFTRSGGPVDVDANDEVYVRAHFSSGGYGGSVLQGSASGAFAVADVGADFASGLASEAPLPQDCAF